MRLILLLIFCPFCFITSAALAQVVVNGTIKNAATHEAIPFATVYEKGKSSGVLSDENGQFKITVASLTTELNVSCLGFEKKTISAQFAQEILLTEARQSLAEVKVYYVNPALKVIEKAIDFLPLHDIESLGSFQYDVYRKTNILPLSTTDTTAFYVSETFSKRYYRAPQSKEIIEATRTSGTKSTLLSSFSSMLETVGFHKPYLSFRGRRLEEMSTYLSPLSADGYQKYTFFMADTLVHFEGDSTFVIEYEPQKGASFDGLKGVLHINSDRYALQYVEAQPADNNKRLRFWMEQEFEPINGHWFPVSIHTAWQIENLKMQKKPVKLIINSHLAHFQVNKALPSAIFDDLHIAIAQDAPYQDEAYWQRHRLDSLTQNEKNTFERFKKQPVFKKVVTNATLSASEWFTSGVIPLGKYIRMSILNLFDANLYEGYRPSLQLRTSDLVSKMWQLDGRMAYGFNDKAWKYEAGLHLMLYQPWQMKLEARFRQDVSEPGNVPFFVWNYPQIPYELLRNFQIARMDSLMQYKLQLSAKIIKNTTVSLIYTKENRQPTYQYLFHDSPMAKMPFNQFQVEEIGLGMRFALGEEFAQVGQGNVITKTPSTTVALYASSGIFRQINHENTPFQKINVKWEQRIRTSWAGETLINFSAAKTWGDLPYPYLYNGRGSKATTNLIWVANHFQTMGLYEFASDQHATAFVTQNFKKLLWKPKIKWMQPDIALVQGVSIGGLRSRHLHQKIDFQVPNKGFFESGVTIDNLLRVPLGKMAFLGAGIGVFRRWGSYALPKSSQNWAYRLVWNVGF